MRQKRISAARLIFIYSLHLTALCIFYNFVSMYLLEIGFSAMQTGIFLSVCNCCSMVSPLLLGRLCDRQGTQKKVLLVSYCIGMIAVAAIYLLEKRFAPLLVCATLFAATELSAAPLLNGMILRMIEDGAHATFGLIRGSASVVCAVVALCAGNIIGRFGFRVSFAAHTVMMLVLIVMIATTPLEVKKHVHLRTEQSNKWKGIFQNGTFLVLMVTTFFIFAGFSITTDLLSVVLLSRGGFADALGIALFVAGIMEALFTMLSPYIIHRFRIRAVLFGSMLCFVGRSALLLASATPTQVLLTQLTQGFCLGLYYPVTIVYINETIPENERNFAQGINCAVSYGAGSMLGNFVGGRVAETYGANAMLTVSGAFCAMGVLIYMFFQLSKRAKSI